MSDDQAIKSVTLPGAVQSAVVSAEVSQAQSISTVAAASKYDRAFHYAWLLINGLLVLSILCALYAVGWEFSTRRYLQG